MSIVKSSYFGEMERYLNESYIHNNNLIARRPKVGYNTYSERQYCLASGVSDYEVFFKNIVIGEVYKTSSYAGDWAYASTEGAEWLYGKKIKGNAHFMNDAVRSLYEETRQIIKESEEDQ